MTPGDAKLCFIFIKHLLTITKTQGITGTVKHLKVASVLLQQILSGYRLDDLTPLGPRIARTKSGLPRFIPREQRAKLRNGDYIAMRFWLTLISVYRNLKCDGFVKLSTITSPSTATPQIKEISSLTYEFKKLFFVGKFNRHSYINNRWYGIGLYSKNAGINPPYRPEKWGWSVKELVKDFNSVNVLGKGLFLTVKSSPQGESSKGYYSAHPITVLRSFLAYQQEGFENLKTSLEFVMNCTAGKNSRVPYLWDTLINSKLDSSFSPKVSWLGRLGLKLESAAKVRIFAMVDIWTQWVLRPFHKALFSCLKLLPMDGTFDQLKPLKRVPFGKAPIYSFDLSAATDRLPLSLQKDIIHEAVNENFAHHWATLLVDRAYALPKQSSKLGLKYPKDYPDSVKYAVGQPMGALSSWAMLAVTHHYIIQYAAWTSGVVPSSTLFTSYALLGDDIIIWDKLVADKYLETMKILGLEINLSKSVLSPKGIGLEFAKRTLINGTDVSPVPFLEQIAARRTLSEMLSFRVKYNLSLLQVLRFLGYGYKVDPSKNSRIVKAIKVALMIPKTSKDLIDLFVPISVYLKSLTEESFLAWDGLLRYFNQNISVRNKLFSFIESNLIRLRKETGKYSLYQLKLESMRESADLAVQIHEEVIRPDATKAYLKLKMFHEGTERHLASWRMWMDYFDNVYDTGDKVRPDLYSILGFYLKYILDLTAELAALKINDLFNPKQKVAASPKEREARARLELWNKWSSIMAKINNL